MERYFSEIEKLSKMLSAAKIPHDFIELFDGYQILVEVNRFNYIDAICHGFSFGHEAGLLEIQGGMTEKEMEEDSVLGFLTAEEVARRFIYCYNNFTSIYEP